MLAYYAVSGVILCVNECRAPGGSQTGRAFCSSLQVICNTQITFPTTLPFSCTETMKGKSLCPCWFSSPPWTFSRGIRSNDFSCQIVVLSNRRKSNPIILLWKLIPWCFIVFCFIKVKVSLELVLTRERTPNTRVFELLGKFIRHGFALFWVWILQYLKIFKKGDSSFRLCA